MALVAGAGLGALSGCASVPDAAQGWSSGRLALRIEAGPGRPAQSLAAAFELRGDGREGELRLLSPLGTLLVSARWGPGLALLVTGKGERRYASLDELSRQALGESLPLAALPDWLTAQPWRGAVHRTLDDGFEQLGWRVDTSARGEGQLIARRAEQPAVTLRVRLDNPVAP
ncbi:MAG: outer membrane lipoprotein LolB [Ideonella sp. WA131b]|nr:outer membrane lipoprotein LolB [Ideonella sp. WA131b]